MSIFNQYVNYVNNGTVTRTEYENDPVGNNRKVVLVGDDDFKFGT